MRSERFRQAIAFALGAAAHAATMWAGLDDSAREREAPGPGWLAGAALVVGFALRCRQPRVQSGLWFVGGVFAAHAGLILWDWRLDPTDHNLLPFEFVFLGIACAPAFVGQWLAGRFDARIQASPPPPGGADS